MLKLDEEFDASRGGYYYYMCSEMQRSTSWKITYPMRAALDIIKGIIKKAKRHDLQERIILPIKKEDIEYVE